jgi:hypothetical protein
MGKKANARIFEDIKHNAGPFSVWVVICHKAFSGVMLL